MNARPSILIAALTALTLWAGACNAQMDVFLNFDSDWETNLNSAASDAGITTFSVSEISLIESNIETELNSVYTDFNLMFSTTTPGGSFTTIDFGASGSSSLGSAPVDYFNLSVTQTANMFVENFDFIVDEFTGSTSRSTQIEQLSMALSGTAAHELGHSIGMRHHHAYGTQAINPSNYGDTGGAQNAHIIATGSTGLGETGRETSRTLSQWSTFMLEAAGGLDGSLHGTTGTALADTVLMESDHMSAGDVGGTIGTADSLVDVALAISGYEHAANAWSSISSPADIDVFSIDLDGAGTITAEVVHVSRWGSSLDTFLEIIDSDGTTILAALDNENYSGDTYGTGTFGYDDSFLINVPVSSAGTYYLRVSSTSGSGNYSLLVGADINPVPEPGSFALLGLIGLGFCLRRRRK